MSLIHSIQFAYDSLKGMEDPDDGIFEFKELLLSSDDNDVLEFHYQILSDKENLYANRDVFSFFSERVNKEKVSKFLYSKFTDEIDNTMKANIIQILGHLRSPYAKELAYANVKSEIDDMRYRSIIVLGWMGNRDDVLTLNDIMLTDSCSWLRGYSATAMRQIWFNNPKLNGYLLKFLFNALSSETDSNALMCIIITIQDLLKKKFGLKENINEASVSGDVLEAKSKLLKFIKDNSL